MLRENAPVSAPAVSVACLIAPCKEACDEPADFFECFLVFVVHVDRSPWLTAALLEQRLAELVFPRSAPAKVMI
jgi:hypothetical protein